MASTELKPIILYDIPCITKGRPWSPNTMKTRYCLGYKRLPFTTVWVEFPDIEGLLLSKGVTRPPYTLPAIEDPNTGAFVVDSLAIATYLDETYAQTPAVLGQAARALVDRAADAFSFGSRGGAGAGALGDAGNTNASAPDPWLLVFLVLGAERLNPISKAYYYQTRAARLGGRWAALVNACSASPEDRAETVRRGIEATKGMMHKVTALYNPRGDGSRDEGPFALGQEPCFLDFIVAGRMKFVLDGLTPSEVESLRAWDRKLASLVENLEKYYVMY